MATDSDCLISKSIPFNIVNWPSEVPTVLLRLRVLIMLNVIHPARFAGFIPLAFLCLVAIIVAKSPLAVAAPLIAPPAPPPPQESSSFMATASLPPSAWKPIRVGCRSWRKG